ncbi:MAG: alanine racemase, partial [Sciscionella sp.]|nr:alanine racemase [Sciscionella sp.]
MISPRIREFIAEVDPPSPCLVVDLDVLRIRWRQFRTLFPNARICYAVKANPHPAIIAMLVELGADFDVASRGEIELCLANGASGDSLSYGNTIKKPADIEFAYRHGIRLFSTDSESDIRAIAKYAPNSAVCCRIQVPQHGARTPFGDKFGCPPAQAPALLSLAARLGLRPRGVALHVGSQNENPGAWRTGIEAAATVIAASTATLAAAGIDVPTLNV